MISLASCFSCSVPRLRISFVLAQAGFQSRSRTLVCGLTRNKSDRLSFGITRASRRFNSTLENEGFALFSPEYFGAGVVVIAEEKQCKEGSSRSIFRNYISLT